MNLENDLKSKADDDIQKNTQEQKEITEEQKDEINTKKLKSKFNLLEQGRLMNIGNNEEGSKNLIIIGPKSSGKSSIFSLLTTGSPNYSEAGTFGINYGFMRTQSSVQKKVMNVYEIGGGIENLMFIKTILNNDNYESTILFITLDFENPQDQLSSLLKYISNLRKIIGEIIDKNIIESNMKTKISQYGANKPQNTMDIFPMETYVIGNKYDILEKIDIEKLKWLCPSLRYFCHINALNLIFFSSKKKETINSLYNTMVEVAFGSGKKDNLKKYHQKHSTKPLYINYFNDNLNDIGEPKIPVTVVRDIDQRWKETYDGLFKNYKKSEKNNTFIDLDESYYQLYKEAKIDHELKLFNEFKENNEQKEKSSMLYKKPLKDGYDKNKMKHK